MRRSRPRRDVPGPRAERARPEAKDGAKVGKENSEVPYSPSAIYARFIAEAISAATSSHMISPSFGETK